MEVAKRRHFEVCLSREILVESLCIFWEIGKGLYDCLMLIYDIGWLTEFRIREIFEWGVSGSILQREDLTRKTFFVGVIE